MRRSVTRFLIVFLVTVWCLAQASRITHAQELPIWQAAQKINDEAFQAQQELFSAPGSDDPTKHYQAAAAHIDAAAALYAKVIQPGLKVLASSADLAIGDTLIRARAAAENGNAPALAAARGRLASNLVWGSYLATLRVLKSGEGNVSDWLRLREYRQATKFSVVSDGAAQALAKLQPDRSNLDTTLTAVSDDLRDAYDFRLRDAFTKLKDTASQNFTTRTAEWAGRAIGYFNILRDDFIAKRGDADATSLAETLANIEQAALVGNMLVVEDSLKQAQAVLANYQPVTLTTAEISKRAQLLLLFIDLVQVEYQRGVADGQITIPIEYQEATSFRNQAESLFEELRPHIIANDNLGATQLAQLLAQMKSHMLAYSDGKQLKTIGDQALVLVRQTLKVDASFNDPAASFTIIDSMLKDLATAVSQNDYETAERKRLEAYAILDAGIEQRLRGFTPDLAVQVESLFWQGEMNQPGLSVVLANKMPVAVVKATLNRLNAALADAQTALNTAKSAPGAVVSNAAVIVFREGLEAVLILSSLMAGMRSLEGRSQRRPLMLGALLALAGTGLTWWFANNLLTLMIQFGERLEAVISLIAIGVLLLITNWFFHKTYWVGWMANFHSRKGRILGGAAIVGPTLGLILLGFTSIYREGFETVLFLQSLVLDAGLSIVFQGVALGLLGTLIVGFITFKLQMRLPYKRMLIVTGILIGVVLLTMVGNTVHVMQVVGWLPISPIAGLYVPYWMGRWFGIFGTWQGILLQFVSAIFVVGSYVLAEQLNQRKRIQPRSSRVS